MRNIVVVKGLRNNANPYSGLSLTVFIEGENRNGYNGKQLYIDGSTIWLDWEWCDNVTFETEFAIDGPTLANYVGNIERTCNVQLTKEEILTIRKQMKTIVIYCDEIEWRK